MARGRAAGYDDQRGMILARAGELFAERGYMATSMNQVAEACGLSKATLYHYYRDKYAILLHIADDHVSRLQALVAELQAEGLAPRPRLERLIVRFVEAYADARHAHRVLTEDVRFLEPADRRRVLGKERQVVQAFAATVAELRPEQSAAAWAKPLTMLLFGMINWMFTWMRPGGALDHARLAPVVADLFLAGLAGVQLPDLPARAYPSPEPERGPGAVAGLSHPTPSKPIEPPMTLPTLQSFIAGRWLGAQAAQTLASAVNGRPVAATHAEAIDFAEAHHHARQVGAPALLGLDFQGRAARLRALAKFLGERKEQLYAWSAHTGATMADGWIDIEGGTGTLSAYAALGSNELPSGNLVHEGPVLPLGKTGQFVGSHVLVPRGGVAVHINAFNFPVWGLLEKFAPSFLAGMPCIAKPATATSYLTEQLVRLMLESGLLPPGALQLVIGGTGDLLDRLDGQDMVTFTGSADTAARLRAHPHLVRHSVPFNAEADSLNCAILAPDAGPATPEFELFVKEVVREMTVKAGQKCTAIRRAIVPRRHLDAVAEALRQRLAKVVVGDPAVEGVRMGALASRGQLDDVAGRVAQLQHGSDTLFGAGDGFAPVGNGVDEGAFFAPTLLLAPTPLAPDCAAHDIEAFGPVSTLMPYDADGGIDEALALAARGRGSLVCSLVTHDATTAAHAVARLAAQHGRVHVLDRDAAAESTGHGSPLPGLKHGGPGRAGGGEELGGLRAVTHYLQRSAVQGSPRLVAAITGEYTRGAPLLETEVHPFRRHFEDLQIGESLLTHRRTVSEADIVAFGGISGDYFYMHFDEIAAKDSPFGQRIAHGYFVLSAAAGLFVSPAPGPVLANYGLDTLRFVKPVAIGDTIRARLTAKRKIDRQRRDANGQGQGVVAWDVAVTNQRDELVASYDILTLVAKRG